MQRKKIGTTDKPVRGMAYLSWTRSGHKTPEMVCLRLAQTQSKIRFGS